jgi:hypothetical protein
MENEELFDAILHKFEGDKSFSRDQIRNESFYKDLNTDYFAVENHLNFLIGEEVLKESYDAVPYVSLTRKGWFIMTNPGVAGYVIRKKESLRKEKREKATLVWAKWATIFGALAVVTWIVDKLLKK